MASSKQHVWGVDVDGVCADWVAAYRQLVKQMHGIDIPDATSWTWYEGYLTEAQDAETRAYTQANPDWWLKLQPYENTHLAFAILNQAAKHRVIDLYFITFRPGRGLKATTEQWLGWQGIDNPTVICSVHDKGHVAQGLGLDVFVDDKPENCRDVMEACPHALVSLITQPWNLNNPMAPGLTRADNLLAVVKGVL